MGYIDPIHAARQDHVGKQEINLPGVVGNFSCTDPIFSHREYVAQFFQ